MTGSAGAARAPDPWRVAAARPRRLPRLGTQVLAGVLIGAAAGALLGERAAVPQPVGDLFIRLLVPAAVPLLLFDLLADLAPPSDGAPSAAWPPKS